MHITGVLGVENDRSKRYNDVKSQCKQFIIESNNLPLYKSLPSRYGDLKRVKVRHKKHDPLSSAYESIQHNVRTKSVFAYATPPTPNAGEGLYYVFPTDGYKFLYSTEIDNSRDEVQSVMETLMCQFDTEHATQLIQNVLKFSYKDVILEDGIRAGCEIMLHSLPAYYAISTASVNYDDLLTILTS